MTATRRTALATAGALLTGAALAPQARAQDAAKKRVLRIAHLTDVHVQPELRAGLGMIACLKHVQDQADRPDVIFFGGDCIMDSFGQTADRTTLQWDLWHATLKNECSLPIENCVGNHDVWGWDKAGSKTAGSEPRWGKAWAVEALGLSGRYRSFDRAGWHFIVLDSTHVAAKPGTYTAKLDDEQFAWLEQDLARTAATTPVLVLSHIPILSATVFFDGQNEKSGDWRVPGAWMHIDARRIKDLFLKHPNVKLCLSGHIHLADRVDYAGVTYYCNGAVSGAWWKGNYHECAPGYGLVNLYSDGSFDNRYVEYGWKV